MQDLSTKTSLPEDGTWGTLVGRVWRPGPLPGPSVVVLWDDQVIDITDRFATVTHLINQEEPAAAARDAAARGASLGSLETVLANSGHERRDPEVPALLAPTDLQALKACGVTFVRSLLERVIEEQIKGDPAAAEAARARIVEQIGTDLSEIVPGSAAAERLKAALIERGLWSQYLEVGIGPDAEIFTKAQPLSAVGSGARIGLHPRSSWNNPEPELVTVINAGGETVGATLGNDVNLRDFEGRSALLLGRSKDNNGSCALGPFIRLFDESFTLDDARRADVHLRVEGPDGFALEGVNSIAEISRDLLDLASQAIGPEHQYPDGLALFTGTMFVPLQDRDAPGEGFTHKLGDVVTISSPKLGALVNTVGLCGEIPPWEMGIAAFMENLARRGFLGASS